MFGYVVANPETLTEEGMQRYRGCYCGLCRTLRQQHHSHITLTYDMAFLVLLLTGLYEPEETEGWERCVMHPLRKHPYWTSRYTEYASDMNVALAYHNCLDDWRDDRNLVRFLLAKRLTGRYRKVYDKWPTQCGAIEECMRKLSELEAQNASADETANCFGTLMGTLFAVKNDMWAGILRKFGNALGRFIYMVDAVTDLREDEKRSRYNPIRMTAEDSVLRTDPERVLHMILASAQHEFEKLPIVQDADVLRNVLYDGIWQKYFAWREKKEAKHPDTGSI